MKRIEVMTLIDAVNQAESSWRREPGDVVASLEQELDRPGGRANVVCWFIDTRFGSAGASISSRQLINGSQPNEIDAAFARIAAFVFDQGGRGTELSEKLTSGNRNLINNYRI